MRTTLTLDDELVRAVKRIAGKRGTSFRAVVNEALGAGIRAIESPPSRSRYRTKVFEVSILPGVDPYKLGQVADEAEDFAKVGARDQAAAK